MTGRSIVLFAAAAIPAQALQIGHQSASYVLPSRTAAHSMVTSPTPSCFPQRRARALFDARPRPELVRSERERGPAGPWPLHERESDDSAAPASEGSSAHGPANDGGGRRGGHDARRRVARLASQKRDISTAPHPTSEATELAWLHRSEELNPQINSGAHSPSSSRRGGIALRRPGGPRRAEGSQEW